MDADGSGQMNLTQNEADDTDFSWSPDGTQLVFSSNRDGNLEIYVVNSDGSEPRNLTQNGAVDSHPDWSSDGARIVFYSNRDSRSEHIYIMNADGTGVQQLTSSPYDDWHPVWLPDGGRIAFVSFRNHGGGDSEIYVIDLAAGPEADGNEPRRLTRSPSHDENPAWRPAEP
jgi:Tol biopolymer transport system component